MCGLLAVGIIWAVLAYTSPSAKAQRDRDSYTSVHCPGMTDYDACRANEAAAAAQASAAAKQAAAAAEAKAKASAEAAQRAEAAKEAERGRLAGLSAAAREAEAKKAGCDANSGPEIAASAKDDKEREKLFAILAAGCARDLAKRGVDGLTRDAKTVAAVAKAVALGGPRTPSFAESTTLGSARKDPDEARGKSVTASGNVIQIYKRDYGFDGTLMTYGGKVIFFVTPFGTDGIEEGSYATFRGVFVQSYTYENNGGGHTESSVLVGGFVAGG